MYIKNFGENLGDEKLKEMFTQVRESAEKAVDELNVEKVVDELNVEKTGDGTNVSSS